MSSARCPPQDVLRKMSSAKLVSLKNTALLKLTFVDRRGVPARFCASEACFCRQARCSSSLLRFRGLLLLTGAVFQLASALPRLAFVDRHGVPARFRASEACFCRQARCSSSAGSGDRCRWQVAGGRWMSSESYEYLQSLISSFAYAKRKSQIYFSTFVWIAWRVTGGRWQIDRDWPCSLFAFRNVYKLFL